jgi:hypothetical protein
MNNRPCRILVFITLCSCIGRVLCTVTLRRAWLREEVRLEAVDSQERCLFPRVRRAITCGKLNELPKWYILKSIIQGKIYGKRGPGRRRISWLQDLRTWYRKTSNGNELFRIVLVQEPKISEVLS